MLLAYVEMGKKFPQCTSFTDVTTKIQCKEVEGLLDVDLEGDDNTPPAPTTVAPVPEPVCKCGEKGSSRIVGGQDADLNEWPWMVALSLEDGSAQQYICGASLIAAEWVLTAAQCFINFNKDQLQAVIGDYDISTEDETARELIGLDSVFMHPDYNATTGENDIALVKLKTPVDLNKHTPVCLPAQGTDFTGEQATVLGWGVTNFQDFTLPTVLQEAEIPVIDNQVCKDAYGNVSLISDTMVCAGVLAEKDACIGDGGGPLSVPKDGGQHQLVGIVSKGIDCASPDYYGVYTNVPSFITEFVIKTLDDNGATFCPAS